MQAPQHEATVTIDAGAAEGALLRLEQYNNILAMDRGLLGPRDLGRLKALGIRVLRVRLDAGAPALPGGAAGGFEQYHDGLDQACEIAEELLLACGGREHLHDGACATDALGRAARELLMHLKGRYPKIRYVEALDECRTPGRNGADPRRVRECFECYELLARAVEEVNAALRPEAPLKVGGPACASFDEPGLGQFLSLAAAGGVRLDFISYHQYLPAECSGRPAAILTEKDRLRALLAERGLDAHLPIFVTEYGVFPHGANRSAAEGDADLVAQAAGMATSGFYYLQQAPGGPIPFHWAVRDGQDERRSQLARGADGVLTPYGNVVRMQSMLRRDRLRAASSAVDESGRGVHVLASGDESGLAAMVWNYQWTTGAGAYDTAIRVENLPQPLAAGELLAELYLVDAAHSNCRRGPAGTELERVYEEKLHRRASYRLRIALAPNAVSLLVLRRASSRARRRRG
jgi:hypothetical protein